MTEATYGYQTGVAAAADQLYDTAKKFAYLAAGLIEKTYESLPVSDREIVQRSMRRHNGILLEVAFAECSLDKSAQDTLQNINRALTERTESTIHELAQLWAHSYLNTYLRSHPDNLRVVFRS